MLHMARKSANDSGVSSTFPSFRLNDHDMVMTRLLKARGATREGSPPHFFLPAPAGGSDDRMIR